jgi:hypothetical protein
MGKKKLNSKCPIDFLIVGLSLDCFAVENHPVDLNIFYTVKPIVKKKI